MSGNLDAFAAGWHKTCKSETRVNEGLINPICRMDSFAMLCELRIPPNWDHMIIASWPMLRW